MTLELSDKYESMSDVFKNKVQKTHCKLKEMISLFEAGLKNEYSKQSAKGLIIKVLIADGIA